MLRHALHTINHTWNLARSRQQLGFIIVLIIIFPLLFTYLLQQFATVASTQVESVLKSSIAAEQAMLIPIIQSTSTTPEQLSVILGQYATTTDMVTTAHIVSPVTEGLSIVAASDASQVGTIITDTQFYQSALGQPTGLIYPFTRSGERIWRSYRSIPVGAESWFIYTEIQLAGIDNRLATLLWDGYLALLLMLLFLAVVVWWLWRQPDIAAALSASQAQLQAQYDFTNLMVHELRAPLTAIRGYASLVTESNTLPTEQQQHMNRVNTSTARLVRLVNDFLEVARLQAGTLTIKKINQDIRPTIQAVVAEQKQLAEHKGLTLTAIVPTQPALITTDVARLAQVITNLCNNAIKYTDTGSVTVALNDKKDSVEIRIKDTGQGISAEDQAKLFQPFVRVGQSDAGTEVGSGLGMWITQKLVTLLGGTVRIESIADVGTHAVVTIPKKSR